jgi:molybdopterin molybdotransferase
MRSVEAAQADVLALCTLLGAETISISEASGHVLAEDIRALRTHPPFDASAMDGYAVHWRDVAQLPATLAVIGESAAGKRFDGAVPHGAAVRIFTGAPMPADCDTVIVQEDVARTGDILTMHDRPANADAHIRRAGLDAQAGDIIACKGQVISPALQGFLAASGITHLPAVRAPRVELLACGDELKLPGEALGADDIVATNGLVLASLLRNAGAQVSGAQRIVADDLALLTHTIASSEADVLVTIGGASVGDRDFVQAALVAAGAHIAFWKIALKPGKPMMVGTRGKQLVIGLPGNPVSAYVCALLFVLPALRALQGRADVLPQLQHGLAAVPLDAVGARTEYLRAAARLQDGIWQVTPHRLQDSAMLSVLAQSNALLVRPAGAAAAAIGAPIGFLSLDS